MADDRQLPPDIFRAASVGQPSAKKSTRHRILRSVGAFGALCLTALIVSLLLLSCTHTISGPGLDEIIHRSYATSFPSTLYYRGSDDQYDYYAVRNGLSQDDSYYRVERSGNDQSNRMPLVKAKADWRDLTPRLTTQDLDNLHRQPASQPAGAP